MTDLKSKKTILQKQIPTLLGLGILIVALVFGLLFFGKGTGVFAPRATPQTTPKNVKITNVTDKSFTVSFFTDEETPGFVKYGESENSMKNQVGDDRDQLSGVVSPYSLHHITVRGLEPGLNYFYVLGTGSSSTFDDNGVAFQIKTASKLSVPPPASKTIYGSVSGSGGTPAEGSVIYLTMPGVGDLSSLVRSSGSWAISLANARTQDGSAYANLSDDSSFSVLAQGSVPSQTTSFKSTVLASQPMQDLILGQETIPNQGNTTTSLQSPDGASESLAMAGDKASSSEDSKKTDGGKTTQHLSLPDENEIVGGGLTDLVEETSQVSDSLDLSDPEIATSPTKVVTTKDPIIIGRVAPGVQVNIIVNSETQITESVVSDEDGNFALDLAQLSEELEPGEHTVAYSYTDPNTGEIVEATYDFVVKDTSGLLAQADTKDEPYGSGNPYLPTSTPTPVATQSATASDLATTKGGTSTRSAVVSTESSVLEAGSVGTTMALVLGGLFFIFTGAWSWWLAGEVRE